MGNEDLRIEGIVEKVIFFNENNGYTVIKLDTDDGLFTVVGNLGKIDEGESLILDGKFIVNQKYGMQFSAEYCERKLPDTSVNIEKFLASGAIQSITKSIAKKIINAFGDDTLNIMEKTPEKLAEIKGISQKRCDMIIEEAGKLFSLKEITTFLSGFDIKSLYAMRFYQHYGTNSLDIIKKNPYILCENGIDLDFKQADIIAEDLKIRKNSSCRITAGIEYVLNKSALDGHSCLPIELLWRKSYELMQISEDDFTDSYEKAVEENSLISYIKNGTEYVYLPEYYEAESFIADKMYDLCMISDTARADADKLIDAEESDNYIKYAENQRSAIRTAISKKVMVLTGGPGTGKTTTLNAIISILNKKKEKVFLAAPTGRAAKRMSELTGYEAKTIHRLLEMQYDESSNLVFFHNEDNPLQCDTVVIDEMSMVDSIIFQRLLEALKPNCRLVIVGDFHQLPSVGAGNVLHDIIDSGIVPVVELTEIFRQAQQSCIITNAHKIVSGEYPDLTQKHSDFFFFGAEYYEPAVNFIASLAKKRLPDAYGYSSFDDIQILTPSRGGNVGSDELNSRLQYELNPPADDKNEYKTERLTLRTGDKVMQIQNNYSIEWKKGNFESSGIFNGDIGRITSIDNSKQIAVIDFDGRIAEYSFELLQQIELAYAITVHKSQGCEFEAVIMPVMDGYEKLSYRSLLYTAVTRAKKILILVGSESKIRRMVDDNTHTERYTCLMDMLRKKG
ncbi:MAG: ATP-dependent RecD-like DNA helicase [Ruminococcus sp.]|nr:ATP-dependent RecD-like DNA helicase [Ruminococcus sp.]